MNYLCSCSRWNWTFLAPIRSRFLPLTSSTESSAETLLLSLALKPSTFRNSSDHPGLNLPILLFTVCLHYIPNFLASNFSSSNIFPFLTTASSKSLMEKRHLQKHQLLLPTLYIFTYLFRLIPLFQPKPHNFCLQIFCGCTGMLVFFRLSLTLMCFLSKSLLSQNVSFLYPALVFPSDHCGIFCFSLFPLGVSFFPALCCQFFAFHFF